MKPLRSAEVLRRITGKSKEEIPSGEELAKRLLLKEQLKEAMANKGSTKTRDKGPK